MPGPSHPYTFTPALPAQAEPAARRTVAAEARRALAGAFIEGAMDDASRFAAAAAVCDSQGDTVHAAMWRDLARVALADARRAAHRVGGTR